MDSFPTYWLALSSSCYWFFKGSWMINDHEYKSNTIFSKQVFKMEWWNFSHRYSNPSICQMRNLQCSIIMMDHANSEMWTGEIDMAFVIHRYVSDLQNDWAQCICILNKQSSSLLHIMHHVFVFSVYYMCSLSTKYRKQESVTQKDKGEHATINRSAKTAIKS